MCETNEFELDIEQRLATIRFICNNNTHISLNVEKCKNCTTKECLHVCPADVYSEEDGTITTAYENCLECGTCRLCCPTGAIEWEYPKDSAGVSYKFG